MNAWSYDIAFLLVNIFHGVVAPGSSIDGPVNTCKAQEDEMYQTEWDLDFTNRKPECAQQCLDILLTLHGGGGAIGWYWEGCYIERSCDGFCKCCLDSWPIFHGYSTFMDAVGNLRRPTNVFQSWFAERFEGKMYLSYDCRRHDPMGLRPKSRRGYDNNGGSRQLKSRRRYPFWRG